jgi:hypothetical protein
MGAPVIDISQPITVDATSDKVYTFQNKGYQKIRLKEISLMWDSNFTISGKWQLEIRGNKITSGGQHQWIVPMQNTMGFSLDLSDMDIILDYDEKVELYANVSTGTGVIQIMVLGEVV